MPPRKTQISMIDARALRVSNKIGPRSKCKLTAHRKKKNKRDFITSAESFVVLNHQISLGDLGALFGSDLQ